MVCYDIFWVFREVVGGGFFFLWYFRVFRGLFFWELVIRGSINLGFDV